MTLEEAQQKILELTEENQNLKQEKETLSEDKKNLTKDVEDLRTLNQKYFNKLMAQDTTKEDKGEDKGEDVPTCEEFAKELKI